MMRYHSTSSDEVYDLATISSDEDTKRSTIPYQTDSDEDDSSTGTPVGARIRPATTDRLKMIQRSDDCNKLYGDRRKFKKCVTKNSSLNKTYKVIEKEANTVRFSAATDERTACDSVSHRFSRKGEKKIKSNKEVCIENNNANGSRNRGTTKAQNETDKNTSNASNEKKTFSLRSLLNPFVMLGISGPVKTLIPHDQIASETSHEKTALLKPGRRFTLSTTTAPTPPTVSATGMRCPSVRRRLSRAASFFTPRGRMCYKSTGSLMTDNAE